ncbi:MULTISPECIES: response regulator transcription factor [Paenibacillus]|uniref:response regulator transcription factor n=1 Tax=Paenibacillus TaxID=44249 RepID=UPI0022B905F5|nr:response regulator transcription factor [Paenibacillus caseinilyticus]MCZ8519142.1 response regulator transcription factor [Paenibacillus caseinilyticus]
MNNTKKVLIVDDHPLIAQATADLVRGLENIQVIGIEGTGAGCLEAIGRELPDVVLLDFHLPDRLGDELAAGIKESYPSVHIIIFTGVDISELYTHFIRIGVSGILSKESSPEVIKLMVSAVLHGQTLLPQDYFRKIRFASGPEEAQPLTEDEVHLMTMVIAGATNEQIAREIRMSKRSVDNYLRRIYEKFGVRSRAQAVDRFLQLQQKTKLR